MARDKRGTPIESAAKKYEEACNVYIDLFCEKQQLFFDGWVSDEVGGIASFACQYFFNMSDIVLDLKTHQPVGLILDWQSDGVDAHFKNPEEAYNINYLSYTMGLRYDQLSSNKK